MSPRDFQRRTTLVNFNRQSCRRQNSKDNSDENFTKKKSISNLPNNT